MKRLRIVAVVGALLAIVGAPLAYAAGLWFGLPIVGGASYCQNILAGVPGTATVCNVTTPAGPSTLSGDELVPADLNPSGTAAGAYGTGSTAQPQSGLIPMPLVASGAYVLTSNNGLVTVFTSTPNGVTNLVLNATGSITTWNVAPPPNPMPGQVWRVDANQNIATLTLQTPSGAVTNFQTTTKPTTLILSTTGAMGYEFIFDNATNLWYRLQ